MNRSYLIGIGASVLLVAGAFAATRQGEKPAEEAPMASVNLRLASISTEARENVDYGRLDQRLQALMNERTMVGMAVGVVENGRITYLKGFGETLAGTGEPVTASTVFRWASVSKGLAATMVAKLAEDGKVNLHSPVASYVSTLKLPDRAEYRATVGDMLSHRLGLYRNAYDNKLEEGQQTKSLRRMLSELNLICPPGTCWSYQNVAYDGASEVVETVTEQSFEAALEQRLFNPLGMTSASVTRDGLTGATSWARPHSAARRELELTDSYYRVPAAGGVNSNIKDLAMWMLAQMGEAPGVLSQRVLQTVHAPLVKTPGELRRMRKFRERVKDPHYGYGWRSYDYAGHQIVGHHGGVAGYRALIMFDPALKSGVVALWNSNTSQPNGIEFEVMDMIYGLPFRDWLELDGKRGPAPSMQVPETPEEDTAAIAAARQRTPSDRG